jgi:hypothetical protein
MKKVLLIAAFSLVTTLGFSQGQINFLNTSGALGGPARQVTTLNVPGATNGTPLTGVNYVAQLFLASDFSAVVSEAPAPFRVSTTSQPGTWNGGVRNFIVGQSHLEVGDTVNLVVRVWDTTLFASYDLAVTGGGVVGQSAAFSYLIPPAGTPPAGLAMANFQAFTVSPVPEPSTIALGILGAGSLLFLRRKK